MGRNRVLSFMSAFGGPPRSPTATSSPSNPPPQPEAQSSIPQHFASPARDSPTPPRTRAERPSSSRPMSMVQTYQPPLMEVAQDTLPELQPIFTFLNSHSNKLYQEGYFLKLNDLDSYGRPNADRTWTECFAQLVGTVLSLWDAAALDAAGQDGEVAPTFINLADASIKMIETLPTRNQDVQPLQNVLSISTAGKNRYLLHFNSLHSLTQWTAGIRLAMFEHATLQESYTGSLIAGKGKLLNNIRVIMDRTKMKTEDWARVRFGAGTPWRRCWCVITPPDEKNFQKQQKSLKKKSVYDRPVSLKGDIKFYDTKKIKKAQPIATITDAYSAYAIYPESKPLIDQSTLVKVEGLITIHSKPESTTEGFVFVMPEAHPAVTGFEMMLRWLFPVFDTFGLYGRPNRLIADTLDSRSLMFALPKERRYGYLEILDVAGLIHTDGSQNWSEKDWRKQLKEVTARRMMNAPSRHGSRLGSRRGPRTSMPSRDGTLRFDDDASIRSSPARHEYNRSTDAVFSPPQNAGTAPPGAPFPPAHSYHARSVSENVAFLTPRHQRTEPYMPSRLSMENGPEVETPPPPPVHGAPYPNGRPGLDGAVDRSSSESDHRPAVVSEAQEIRRDLPPSSPPEPVSAPPAFAHHPGDQPQTRPNQAPDLRRANSRMSSATLAQLVDAGKMSATSAVAAAGAAAAWKNRETRGDQGQRGVIDDASKGGMTADQCPTHEGMVAGFSTQPQHEAPPVPVHGQFPSEVNHAPQNLMQRPEGPPRINTNKSVARKPVPQQMGEQDDDTPDSLGSFRHAVDQDALDQVIARTQTHSTEGERHDGESAYDGDSTASPDYASTRRSTETKRSAPSEQRPRTGVLKTVGTVEPTKQEVLIGDVRYQNNAPAPVQTDIPTVDFGPTQAYNPGTKSRPSTSVTMQQWSHDRTKSSDSLTPNEEKRYSYGGTKSPGPGPNSRGNSRSPSREDPRRSQIWQPGTAVGRRVSPDARITPEQFVQQRAAAARVPTPVYAHQRQSSHTPPLSRNHSGDWSAHQRQASLAKDVPPRPSSRRASTTLGTPDYSAHLSAREQEHVARMTGSPLLNMSSNKQQQPQGAGLVGAIEAREREKKEIKEGLSSQMVQHAIAQRQQQAQQQAQAQQAHPYNQQYHQGQMHPSQSQQNFTRQSQYGGWSSPQQQVAQPQWTSTQAQVYWGGQQAGYQQAGFHQQQGGQQQGGPQWQQQCGGFYGSQGG